MSAVARPVLAPFSWSVALHAAIAGLLFLGLMLPEDDPAPVMLPIEAVVVDQAVLAAANRQERDRERREAALERERAAAEAERQERERLARLETERAEQAEAQRVRETELAAKREAEAEAARRKAEQQAQARAADERKRAAEEARLRAANEADLRARLAAEEERTGTVAQGLKAEYVRMIQSHVEQRWYEPPGTAPGVRCTVHVQQIPGGEVVGVKFGDCNGGAAFRQSIETAVRNASPLPPPPQPALFEREVRLVFTPQARP